MSRPLTVLQLLPALESGGVERSTIEIASALAGAGHRPLVASAGGRLLPALRDAGAEHFELPIGRKSLATPGLVRPLRRLMVEQGVDIVHARSRLPAWIGWLALGGIRGPARPGFVTTVHGLNSPSRYSRIMARGERVVCVSQTVRAHVMAHYPDTPAERLRVIPRGIDAAAFPRCPLPDPAARAAAAAADPRLAGEGPLLLLPGRGTRLKGHADALDLLAALRTGGHDARLWMPGARDPGRAAYVAELEARARERGILHAVAITAPTDAIAAAYAACDVVLQLSRKPEAFGRTVIEALAVGRPVLGWDHGGTGELLRELQPDGAVPAFDADRLHAAASALLARAPAAAARIPPAVPERLSLRSMQDATLSVYDELR